MGEQDHKVCEGRVFYIDSIQGDDSNCGFSPETAWKSLEKVNAHTFFPGDCIRFCRGREWKGMFTAKGNGTAWSPIVVEAYGQGKLPQIHGDGAYAAVLLEGVSGWVIRELAVTNQAETRRVRQGICICGSPQGITENIVVEGCEISQVTGENRRARDVYQSMYWNSGIYVTMPGRSSDKDHLHNIIISNNYVHDVLTSGIRVNQQEDFINDIHHTHVVVRGNRIARTGSDGIIVANCISPLIDGNVCLDAGALGSLEDTRLIAGIWVCATSDALIQRNEVGATRLFENDGTAFDTDWGTAGDTVFQYNYTHDNQGGFWLDCMGINRNRECKKTVLRYNISVNDKRCLIQDDYGLPAHLYGNLFVNTKEGPQICCHKDGESHVFWNNLFYFADKPANGWQRSGFRNNWYSDKAGIPECDKERVRDCPAWLLDVLDKKPASGKECGRVWNALAEFAMQ